MIDHDSGLEAGLRVLATLITIAIGAVVFVISLGTLLALIFGASSLTSVTVGGLILGDPRQAGFTKIVVAMVAFLGIVLVASGVTYLYTNDPGIAGVMMGSNGFVGMVVVLIGAAVNYRNSLRK